MSLDTDIGNLIASSQALVDTFEGKKSEIDDAVLEALSTIPSMKKVYYVDQVVGNNSNSGSSTEPLKTIQEAANRTPYGGKAEIRLQDDYVLSSDETIGYGEIYIMSADGNNPSKLVFTARTDDTTISSNGLSIEGYSFIHFRQLIIELPDIDGLLGTPDQYGCVKDMNSAKATLSSIKLSFCDVTAPASTIAFCSETNSPLVLFWSASTFNNMAGNWIVGLNNLSTPSDYPYVTTNWNQL